MNQIEKGRRWVATDDSGLQVTVTLEEGPNGHYFVVELGRLTQVVGQAEPELTHRLFDSNLQAANALLRRVARWCDSNAVTQATGGDAPCSEPSKEAA